MKKIKIALAQMNPTVGDLSSNSRKIKKWIANANRANADLIVFPEVALCGYPIMDLANMQRFIDKELEALSKIVQSTRKMNIAVALGFVDRGEDKVGRSYNAMAWIQRGKIVARQYKRLLPTYDVFLEEIFFKAGTCSKSFLWKGFRVGPTICEDIWDSRYQEKPLKELIAQKSNFIVNISASPFFGGVGPKREALLKKHAAHYQVPILYVNQVGAQDDLVFDGRSLFVDESGQILFKAPAFEEGLYYFEWKPKEKSPLIEASVFTQENRIEEIHKALVLGIRDYCRKNNFRKVVLGLSGGIDSAVVAALAVTALGKKAVLGVAMPSTYSSKGSWVDAQDLAKRLGIDFVVHPIRQSYESLRKLYRSQRIQDGVKVGPLGKVSLAMENLQARLRGMHLMYLSNDEGRLLLTTGNKSEMAVGYCTLYGDMAGGLGVIGDVYKTDVYRLAWYCNRQSEVIPNSIITKPPSAELRPGQKDSDSLPAYEVLDEILRLYIEKNQSIKDITKALRTKKISSKTVCSIIQKVDHNEYKRRQSPPILRVTEKAWFGRRMPITNQFRGT